MECGKVSDYLADEIKKGAFIVVRNMPLRLSYSLSKRVKTPVVGRSVGTLQDFALLLLRKNLSNPKIMTTQERLFLVRRILKGLGNNYFNSFSYVSIVDSRIRELKEHNVALNLLSEVSEDIKGFTGKKLKETVEIIKLYNNYVKNLGKYDIFSLFEKAKGLETGYKKLIFLFPPQILPLEIDFVNSLNIESEVLLFETNNKFPSFLSRENVKLLKEWKTIFVKPSKLSKNFGFEFESVENKSFVKLFADSFATETEGIRKVALTIVKLLNKGVLPEEIVVTGRSLEGKEILLKEIFSEYGIPYVSQSVGIPVASHPDFKRVFRKLENVNERFSVREWVEKILELTEEGEGLKEELKIVSREITWLEEKGILEKEKTDFEKFEKILKLILADRTFILNEEQPFGVFVGNPEAVPSLLPKYVIFYDISKDIYPRSFPLDPDFSYQERELINKKLGVENMLQEAFPGREKLISYEFQTFYNIIASENLDEIHFIFDKKREKSSFISILENLQEIKRTNVEFLTETGKRISKLYNAPTDSYEVLIENGAISYRKKLQGDKKFAFIFSPSFIKEYIPKNLSVTDIISYLDSPVNFFFSKILSVPYNPSVEAIEGEIYHTCIEKWFQKKENIEEIFEEAYSLLKNKTDEETLELVKPFLKRNITEFLNNWKVKSDKVEVEKRVRVKLGDYTLSGRVDWINFGKDSIEIIDFKRANVNNGKFSPYKKKSFQIVLYGLSLFEDGNVMETYKKALYKKLRFTFISIPKFNTFNDNWKISFSGKEEESAVGLTLIFSLLSLKLIEEGVFFPYEIRVLKPSGKSKQVSFSLGKISDDVILEESCLQNIKDEISNSINSIKKHCLFSY